MTLNCLIIDDEPLAIKVLEAHIANIPSLTISGTSNNAFEAMDILKQGKTDLMFLDIQMPKLMGHEFLRTLRAPPKVIFTTAYKEYALDAFELDAIDYLLKPITLERLMKAVNKVNNNISVATKEEESIVDNAGFLYFRAERKMIKVKYNEIVYIESVKDYVKIVRLAEKTLLVKQSISSLEEVLPSNLFLRVHRSYIVALTKIVAFTNHDVEIGGIEIPIGRLYTSQVRKMTKKQ